MEENGENQSDLIKIKVSQLIKFAESFVGVEVHLLISGKFVKMNYANDQFLEILRKLQQRNMDEVYLKNSDCGAVLEHIKHSLSSKQFYDPKTTNEQRVETLDGSHEIAKTFISRLGVNRETIEVMKSVNQKALSLLSESPSIYAFIKNFKKNCSEEFMIAITTGYLTSLVIEKFPWKSVHVKEKAGLAAILCDVTLKKEDFALIREHYKSGLDLDQRIKNHPKDVTGILGKKKELIPMETITIIEQHHERPDGKGFPVGIDIARFNQLSAIFIVCQRFTEMLFVSDFDYGKRGEVLTHLQSIYHGRIFDKSMAALISVVDT